MILYDYHSLFNTFTKSTLSLSKRNVWKDLKYFKVKKSGHMVGQLRPVELVVKGFEKEKGNLSLLAAAREKSYHAGSLLLML